MQPKTKSAVWGNNLIVNIRQQFGTKIVYLSPFLGDSNEGFLHCVLPLRDSLAKGGPTTTAGAASWTEATGLQSDGTVSIFDTKIKASELGTSNAGGMGYWELNIAFDGSGDAGLPAGAFNSATTEFYGINAAASGAKAGCHWGLFANEALDSSAAATNGHFYAERSSSTSRKIYKDGSLLATNTTSDTSSGAADKTMAYLGYNSTSGFGKWHGRCGVFYLTDGTLGDSGAAAFDTFLRAYLFTPIGRPTS